MRGQTDLLAAARATWPDLSDEEASHLHDRLIGQLDAGGFHYIVAAQRFTSTVERTVEYLNAVAPQARFYAVEVVKFADDAISAFEARAVLRPTVRAAGQRPTALTNEVAFLDSIADDTYRDALHQLLEACRGLNLRPEWGSLGVSIRLPTPDRPEPLTIAWLFPPGRPGWMNLTDLSLGFDTWSSAQTPSIASTLDDYLDRTARLPGAERSDRRTVRAYHFPPDAVVRSRPQIVELLADLVQQTSRQA